MADKNFTFNEKGFPIAGHSYWNDSNKKEAFNYIIERMCEGDSVNRILRLDRRKDLPLPSYGLFLDWLVLDATLNDKYAHAQQIRAEVYFDEIIDIADTQQEGTIEEVSDKGIKVITKDATEHRKIRIDSRKFAIARMNPKKFSEKMQVDTTQFEEQKLFPDLNTDEKEIDERAIDYDDEDDD